MTHLTAWVARLRGNAVILLGGQIGRITLQGGYFVLLARGLGADDFGATAAVVALVSMLLPFSSFGSVLLLLKNVAQRHDAAGVQWANSLSLIGVSGVALTALLLGLSRWVAPSGLDVAAVAAVGLADLVFGQVVEAARSVFHAKERMTRSAYFPVILQGGRLLALIPLLMIDGALTPSSWAFSYLLASVPVAAVLGVMTSRHVGWCSPRMRDFTREWRMGTLFMVGMSSTTVYNDVDKALLARLSTFEATGIYSAAYRIVDMSYAPVRSLLGAASPAMWRAGPQGLLPVLDVVRVRLLRPTAAYCVVGTVAMFVGAGLVPLVFGEAYRQSVPALRALSFLLLIKGCHYVVGDTLTCAGHQGARTVVQIAIAVGNAVLCFMLIPRFSWQGAVVASLLSDGLLAVGLLAVLGAELRRERSPLFAAHRQRGRAPGRHRATP